MKRNSTRPAAYGHLTIVTVVAMCMVLAVPAAADTQEELTNAALRFSPEFTAPVLTADGSPFGIVHELNGDGREDIAFVTVLVEPEVPTTFETLRQNSRLFRRGDPRPLFVLETYFAGDEAVQTVELGRWPALDGIELLELTSGAALPVAVAVTTRGAAGAQKNLVIYSTGGMIRRLELGETQQERHELGDLDGDGTLDIVVSRRLPEAGRGYETFIEFLTLEGNAFAVRSSFGLVRELTTFLSSARTLMLAGAWEELAGMIRADGTEAATVLTETFHGVADDEEMESFTFDYHQSGTEVTEVMFPSVMESPFLYPYLGETCTIVFRVETADAYARVYSAVVALSSDPTSESRFAFLTHDGSGQ